MKCPWCNRTDFVPAVAIRHAEAYGGGSAHFKCTHCKKIVFAYLSLNVNISHISKSPKKDSDFAE